MVRLLASAAAIMIGLALLPAGAGASPGEGAQGERIPDRYIVVLERGHPGEVAEEHRRDHGVGVRHVYRHALRGYAARMSAEAAERIAADDRVAYVSPDAEVAIAHHQCGHTGGPPSSEAFDCYAVEGTVVTDDGDEPIAGATVELQQTGQSAETDGDGDYAIEDVENGEYTVTADADGFEPASEEIEVDNGDVEVNFELAAEEEADTGSVSGTVTDTNDDPLEGATVGLEGTEHYATTDGDGEYTIEDVDPGEHEAMASKDGYETVAQTVVVDHGEEVSGVDFTLRADGAISGLVTDEDGEAVEGATIAVDGEEAASTDAGGAYETGVVDAGDRTVTAEADGFAADSQTVEVDGAVEDVDFVLSEADHEHEADEVPWGVERVGAAGLHGHHTGAGVSVYVIDTGIDPEHVDLEPNLAPDDEHVAIVDCHRPGRHRCAEDWADDHMHGTHVAGTVAATDDDQVVGVAPEATLHAVKVLDRRGRGSRSDVIAGVDWVAEQAAGSHAPVVANMSLGGGGSRDGECTADGFVGDDAYHEALCNAAGKGVVFAVAAGNSDDDAAGTVPAAYHDAALAVSATDETDAFAEFTNWGDDHFGWTDDVDGQPDPQSAPVALAAPGVDVLSTDLDDGLHEGSGTSMAAPHVAGAAALLIAAGDVSADGRQAFLDVRAALMGNAKGTSEWDDHSSFEDGSDLDEREEGFLDVRFLE